MRTSVAFLVSLSLSLSAGVLLYIAMDHHERVGDSLLLSSSSYLTEREELETVLAIDHAKLWSWLRARAQK